jgi:hypothetical protein
MSLRFRYCSKREMNLLTRILGSRDLGIVSYKVTGYGTSTKGNYSLFIRRD